MVIGVHTDEGRPADICYEVSRAAPGLVIRPVNRYLNSLRSGATLEGGWGRAFRWPVLDVKVVNNTSEAVLLHEAILDVRSSAPDLRTLPVLTYLSTAIEVRNDGWGPLEDCTLTFSLFTAPGASRPVGGPFVLRSSALESRRDRRASSSSSSSSSSFWSVADALQSCGVDTKGFERLKRSLAGAGLMAPEPSRATIRSVLGPFSDRQAAYVEGTLEYTHPGPDGTPVRSSNSVRGMLYLYLGPPRVGAYLAPGHAYSTVLPSTGRAYRVSVPLSQFVQSGEADRFLVTIASDRSAVHDFSLVLKCNDREVVVAEHVKLELFLPRSKSDGAPRLPGAGVDGDAGSGTGPGRRRTSSPAPAGREASWWRRALGWPRRQGAAGSDTAP